MKVSLQNRFESYIRSQQLFTKNDWLLVACSGGIDSVVLCHLLAAAGYSFSIAHCNFQLRGEDSHADEQFAHGLAEELAVPVLVKHFDTANFAAENKQSIQMAARELRYGWFNELLESSPYKPAWLLTAHHADDSMETMMMNLFKGTGLAGMHGILPKQGTVVRPLLFARKEEIREFAVSQGLVWRDDVSNASDKYTRNFFRLHVLPLVEKAIPNASANLLQSIEHLKESEAIYTQAIGAKKKDLLKQRGSEVHIPVNKLKQAQPLATIAFEIIRDYGFASQQVDDLLKLLDADTGKYIASATHRIIKNRNWLIIAEHAQAAASTILIEENDSKIVFDGGSLSLKKLADKHISTQKEIACLDAKKIKFPLVLRRWRAGDYFYPLGMPKKKKLARFLIDQKLSKTEKENIWVLVSNQHIVWVLGHRIDDRFKIVEGTTQLLKIVWTK